MWAWLVQTMAKPVLGWITGIVGDLIRSWQVAQIKRNEEKNKGGLDKLSRQLDIAKEIGNEQEIATIRARMLGIKRKDKK